MDPDEKTLDYQTPTPRPTFKRRIALLLNTAAWTLFAPSTLVPIVDFTINQVRRHWMSGYAFDVILEIFLVCDITSAIIAIIAGSLGCRWAWLVLVLNLLSLLLMPSLEYA